MLRTRGAVAAALSLLVSTEAHARFHLAHIGEVMSGVNGDPTAQYVEVVMETVLQDLVQDTVLSAFDCDGSSRQELLILGTDVVNAGADVRFLIASRSPIGGVTPDFTWDPGVAGNIATPCGMVCWGAPGVVTPAPGSWNHDDPNQYVDCVAYGGYTETTKTSTHDATDPSGTPTALAPGDDTLSLTRTGDSGDNAADFALACPSPTNNAGAIGDFGPCNPASTTTTVAVATTTTTKTTLVAVSLPPALGGGSRRTDCYGSWRVAAGTGKPVVRCRNGDPCDAEDHAEDCRFLVQLCFADTAATVYQGKCRAAAVTVFTFVKDARDDVDRENVEATIEAVLDLGGQPFGDERVDFPTPIQASVCTGPFTLTVPLKSKGGRLKKGVRTLRTVTLAGKRDGDRLKLICTP